MTFLFSYRFSINQVHREAFPQESAWHLQDGQRLLSAYMDEA